MQKARGYTWGQAPSRASTAYRRQGFRNYFTPLDGVLFTFPSRYWYTIGLWGIFSLGGWSPQFHSGFHVPRATQDTAWVGKRFRLRGYNPLWPDFSDRSPIPTTSRYWRSYNPGGTNPPVWANPRSLAATRGISVDFYSSGYLDVSVPRVRLHTPMYSV